MTAVDYDDTHGRKAIPLQDQAPSNETRSERQHRWLRYLAAAIASAFLTLGLPIVLSGWLGVWEPLSVALAFLVSFAFNFWSIRSFVFRSAGDLRRQVVIYLAVSAGFRALEYGGFLLLFALGWDYRAALVTVLGVSFVAKYMVHNRLVFRGPRLQPTTKS